jgi:serine/threonine protein kinase
MLLKIIKETPNDSRIAWCVVEHTKYQIVFGDWGNARWSGQTEKAFHTFAPIRHGGQEYCTTNIIDAVNDRDQISPVNARELNSAFGLLLKKPTRYRHPGAGTALFCCPDVQRVFKPGDGVVQRLFDQAADMWALGVIVYIMLTGVHPFDETGRATDEEIEAEICNVNRPLPLGPDHPYTRHLSPSARDLIRRLMERNPKERLSAFEMLHHPWVTGKTASTNIMAGSDKRLDKFRKFKTRLQTQFFTDAVGWSDEAILTNEDETRRRTSLIERSFKAIDGSEQARKKLLSSLSSDSTSRVNAGILASEAAPIPSSEGNEDSDGNDMTMSDYHDLLSENMQQKYFPKGHIVYKQ